MAKERHYGLDLLRIVSMLMVVILHLLGHGGVIGALKLGSFNHFLLMYLFAGCTCAVDLFVLLSGYFSVRSEFNVKRLAFLMMEVLFYSLTIYFLSVAFGQTPLGVGYLLQNLFPVFTGRYWFFSTYVALTLLSPFLNCLLRSMNKGQCLLMLCALLGICSVWKTTFGKMAASDFGGAYSLMWFIVLYCVGAYLRLYDITLPKHKSLLLYGVCTLLCAGEEWIQSLWLNDTFVGRKLSMMIGSLERLYFGNNSVLIFLTAVGFFLFFKSVKIRSGAWKKCIAFLSPLTFGVYLIHDNHYVRPVLWETLHMSDYAQKPYAIFVVIGVALSIFLIGCAIEGLRRLLFRPIERSAFWDRLQERLTQNVHRFIIRVSEEEK